MPYLSAEEYQTQIKELRRRQALADLPFRGLAPHRTLDMIAFSSGVNNDNATAVPTWSLIEQNRPGLMILTATADMNPVQEPDYRSVREKIPFMTTWYEHDYSQEMAKKQFVRHWPYVKPMLSSDRDGVYHSQIFGEKNQRVHVILLDQSGAKISERQWQWLRDELQKPASLRILTNVAEQSEKLHSLIAQTGANNVILIPTHQPAASLYRKSDILCEVAPPKARNPSSAGENGSFGLIRINWAQRTASVEIKSATNKIMQTMKVNF